MGKSVCASPASALCVVAASALVVWQHGRGVTSHATMQSMGTPPGKTKHPLLCGVPHTGPEMTTMLMGYRPLQKARCVAMVVLVLVMVVTMMRRAGRGAGRWW